MAEKVGADPGCVKRVAAIEACRAETAISAAVTADMQPLNLGRQSLDDGPKNNNRGVRIELSLSPLTVLN
jgi:hypothetical protein